jgi:hypothetical protein
MNCRKINILTALAFATVFMFASCSKDDGAIPNRIGIEDVPAVSMNTEAGGIAATINIATAANFQGKFKASMYFASEVAPNKIDIVVRKSASSTTVNNTNVKVFKTDVTTLPANFTITVAELEALFGAPIANKEVYDFGPNLYVGAKKYEAFPATGAGSGSGVNGMGAIGFGEYLRYTIAP